jgi:hypothetical protein
MRILAVAASALILAAAPAVAETNVGVTAAVNQSANGTVAGNVRTISLGDNVIFNERIQTGGEGLVQILLADGTTFMVGPNSDLVIDSFVYDPNAGTAEVTASFTKGVLRFIGGQASKGDGGVTINTPVGTMGIRGAVVDVVLDPPPGTPQHVDMLFGNEVTLEAGKKLLGRLYAAGYSLVLGVNGQFEVKKTPPGWGSQIQQALAGQPGTKGGAPKSPTNDDVQGSEFAENNLPDDPPGLNDREIDQLLEAAAQYDELRDFILNNQSPQGFVGGVLIGNNGTTTIAVPVINEFNSETGEALMAEVAFDADGNPVRIKAPIGSFYDGCAVDDGCLVYEGGTEEGEITANLEDGVVTQPSTSYLYDHTQIEDEDLVVQLGYELDCDDCNDFVRWGFWGLSADDVPIGNEIADISVDGMWVTGDLTTQAQLGNLAQLGEFEGVNAYYAGDAVGQVYNNGESYVATGDLTMGWNFADREGWLDIYDFDGNFISGTVESAEGQAGFSGYLWAGDTPEPTGFASGAFVNDGATAAGGVIGNFGFTLGPDYLATGVFFGQQDTPL